MTVITERKLWQVAQALHEYYSELLGVSLHDGVNRLFASLRPFTGRLFDRAACIEIAAVAAALFA